MEFWGNSYSFSSLDPNAAAYIAAVQAADGQALEAAVASAINAFVVGCKADGIWNAIQASCILAGARTLSGALVPLAGAAPTNFNFVAGDYNRKTGLKGNGFSKYLNSNTNTNSIAQNSFHMTAYRTEAGGSCYVGSLSQPYDLLDTEGAGGTMRVYLRTGTGFTTSITASSTVGLIGASRTSSTNVDIRVNSTSQSSSSASTGRANGNLYVFGRDAIPVTASFTSARLAFYSIGESLNLALLDARVTALINALAAAIP